MSDDGYSIGSNDTWSIESEIDEVEFDDFIGESDPEELFPRVKDIKDSPETKKLKEDTSEDLDSLIICFKCKQTIFLPITYRKKTYCTKCYNLFPGVTKKIAEAKPAPPKKARNNGLDVNFWKGAVVLDVSNCKRKNVMDF